MNLSTAPRRKKCFLDKKIYRIMPFWQLDDMVKTNKNTLAHPSMWTDRFEIWRMENIFSDAEGEIKSRYFGQCWTLETKSDALWTIHSEGTDGIRIQTTVGTLLKSLENSSFPCQISEVVYLDKDKIQRVVRQGHTLGSYLEIHFRNYSRSTIESALEINGNTADSFLKTAKKFMYKRLAFRYEREVRLICCLNEHEKGNRKDANKKTNVLYPYKICANHLIKKIKTHPLIEKDEHEKIKRDLVNAGFKDENLIEESELHDLRPKVEPNL